MLVQNTKQSNRSKVLSIIALVLVIVTAIVVYFVFFTEPEIDLGNASNILQRSSVDTDFPTELFESEQLKQLKMNGPPEVKPQYRGRASDPFKPF